MLTDTTLRSAVEALWDKLWSGGLANPLDAIEQLSFLLFLKRLDEREQDAERAAKLRGALRVLLPLVEAFEEEQEGQLLDRIEGIGQPAGPEFVPESLDGGAECDVGEHGLGSQ